MEVLLRNPAPDDPDDQVYWGDTFFGRALARCLEDEGCRVRTQYWPNWDGPEAADLLLVLRGIRKVEAFEGDFRRRAIWIISHPEDVDDEELARFDLVFCGSDSHSHELRERGFNAHTLLQCTDDQIFYPGERDPETFENAFIFVGNARAEREIVHDAVAANLPLRIWGRGWGRHGYDRCVVAPYIDNAKLGDLYRASFCTLNDHWSDMARLDYVNNRIFDALACGLPVLSDPHEGLEKLGFGGIRYREPGQPIDDMVDLFLVDYEQTQEAAYRDSEVILERHTFAARVRQILNLVPDQSF